jgi:hypothetical protein
MPRPSPTGPPPGERRRVRVPVVAGLLVGRALPVQVLLATRW